MLQMAAKLNTFSVACGLPSEIRTKEGEEWVLWKGKVRISVKSLRGDFQDVQPAPHTVPSET